MSTCRCSFFFSQNTIAGSSFSPKNIKTKTHATVPVHTDHRVVTLIGISLFSDRTIIYLSVTANRSRDSRALYRESYLTDSPLLAFSDYSVSPHFLISLLVYLLSSCFSSLVQTRVITVFIGGNLLA